ncbi:MAG TPA: hypothetical protein ENI88_12265 [Desulfobulbus sp.]|nr:hypothetical protein [Desulfobulbus sp.]
MARLPRISPIGIPVHLIQRGNNRQACFVSDEDHGAYAGWLKEYSQKYKVAIHVWVMMTNHVHLLCTPRQEGGVSKMMQSLGRRYVQYFNFEYRRKVRGPGKGSSLLLTLLPLQRETKGRSRNNHRTLSVLQRTVA